LFLWQRFSDVIHRHITAVGYGTATRENQSLSDRGSIPSRGGSLSTHPRFETGPRAYSG
jgi:hypothetical protein